MPFEVVTKAAPNEVTPQRGKGALGTWRFFALYNVRTQCRVALFYRAENESASKPHLPGV